MQINTLKIKTLKKKRKTIGRGGKKGTYSGKGNKGQKARSGAKIDPLFEGGRSTLIDHMKKKRGFKALSAKAVTISLDKLERNFKDNDRVTPESLMESKLIKKSQKTERIKILGTGIIKKKLTIAKGILASASAKKSIEAVGGKIE